MTSFLPGRRTLLFFGSLLFALYVLAPIAWLVSSSFQSEAEITSVPPHWVPEQPTLENFAAIFQSSEEVVTYENRKEGDTATGGFIPSTAANLLPSMKNSFIVALAVVVLNLLVSVPAAYALAKIRFIGRTSSIYFMLSTRVIPDIALVVPFFLFVQKLGLMDNLWALIITYLAITVPFYLLQRLMPLSEMLDQMVDGFKTMLPAIGIVIAAFIFKDVCDQLMLPQYVVESLKPYMSPQMLPAMVFLAMAVLAFATGSSWGIFAVTIPIVMPLAYALEADIPLTIGALLSASAFGSQACFYSDSTVLAAQGSGCNLISHAITQLPYTLIAAGLAFIGFILIA